jgi:chemotaxis receptor (MCP) glutamine deamidase CheD
MNMIIHWVGIGEVKSAGNGDHLGTILGSCVTTVLWHAQRRFAVMNHILLPYRPRHKNNETPDGRFAGDSWRMMQTRLARQGISLHECEAFVAGGANVHNATEQEIGHKNVETMLGLIEQARVPVREISVGGNGHRTARFDPEIGLFRVMHNGIMVNHTKSLMPGSQAA